MLTIPGIGMRTAAAIKEAVGQQTGKTGPGIVSINTATGEIEEG